MKLSRIAALVSLVTLSQSANAAVYKVVDQTNFDQSKYAFGTDINASGQITGHASSVYNFPVDLEELDLEQTFFTAYSLIEDLENGIVSAKSIDHVKAWLESLNNTSTAQKIGDEVAITFGQAGSQYINVYDVDYEGLDSGLTRSTKDKATAINDDGVIVGVGTSPFVKIKFTTTPEDEDTEATDLTLWGREFSGRGFYQFNGEVKPVMPEFAEFGGESSVRDISNSGYMVGHTSIELLDIVNTAVEETCDGNLLPVNVCFWNFAQTYGEYHTRPVRWKLDTDGNIVETKIFDLAMTPDEDYNGAYVAQAFGVNEQGVVVGVSNSLIEEDDTIPSAYPVVYRDDEVIDFIDHNEYRSGAAVRINDDNIVVGYASKFINGFERNKFFVYDLDNDTVEFPIDFFTGSSSRANDINNNGLVVGDGEFETETGRARRRHGFIYDINEKTFSDLNDFITCDSPYEIVQANAINDDNTIVATAVVRVEARDAKGELEVDENGAQVYEEVSKIVTLEPIAGGEAEDCESEVLESFERKGASTSWLALLPLSVLAFVRRRKLFLAK